MHMRFNGLVILASALVLGACAGGDKAADTDTAATVGATTAPAVGTTTGAATTPAATGTAAPITGTTHEVKMVGDAQGYRFEPANITVKAGDGIKWVMVSGGPHNVAFDAATVPAAAKGQLSANMPNQAAELTSPMFMNAGESYTVSFANVAPGTYNYVCQPHLAMNMKGVVTVTQ
jgi:plastocyanin